MQTLDFHVHLLSKEVHFDRPYDRLALCLFGRRFGIDVSRAIKEPYEAYVDALLGGLRASKYVKKAVLFGVDAKFSDAGELIHRDKTVCADNDSVFEIYQKNPGLIVPFFSINPKRADALDEIDRCFELGFKGAKFLQNYWDLDTRLPRYVPYFEKLAKLGLPLVIHVGNESSVPSTRRCEALEMIYAPLELGVTTVCAHMAINYEYSHIFRALSRRPRNFGHDYFALLALLRTHKNLYADVSALMTPVRAKALPHLASQTDVHSRLLYASDFPVPYSAIYNTYDLRLSQRIALHKEPNPFDRNARGLLAYFGEQSELWSNYKKILPFA